MKSDELSKYIKGSLVSHGVTQRQMAKVMGITQQALSKKLKYHSLTAMDLICIFSYLDTPPDDMEKVLKKGKT